MFSSLSSFEMGLFRLAIMCKVVFVENLFVTPTFMSKLYTNKTRLFLFKYEYWFLQSSNERKRQCIL